MNKINTRNKGNFQMLQRTIVHTRPTKDLAWHHETTDPTMSTVFKQLTDFINTNYPGINTADYVVSADGLTLTITTTWTDEVKQAEFDTTDISQTYRHTVWEYYYSNGGTRTVQL